MLPLIHLLYNTFFFLISSFIIFFIFYKIVNKIIDVVSGYAKRPNDYVLITGCDSGLGYLAVKAYNENNLFVFAACLTREGVDRLSKDDKFRGKAFVMDITKLEDIESARTVIEKEVKEKGLWCVVNNAGVVEASPIEWISTDDMKHMMDINLWGTINVTRIMLPLVKKCMGRIVMISSVHGRVFGEYFSSYCVSKSALTAFSDCLRYEMIPWKVSVSLIEPGGHDTGIGKKVVKKFFERESKLSEETKLDYGANFAMNVLRSGFQNMTVLMNDPNNLMKTYLHAVLSARPRARYLVGWDANTVYLMLNTLPIDLGDFIKYLFVVPVVPAAMKKLNVRF